MSEEDDIKRVVLEPYLLKYLIKISAHNRLLFTVSVQKMDQRCM